MAAAPFIPSSRGFLALAAIVANDLIIPALVPAYDGPRFSPLDGVIAIVLGVLTAVLCLRGLQRGGVADWFAGALSIVFACWMFYVLLERIL